MSAFRFSFDAPPRLERSAGLKAVIRAFGDPPAMRCSRALGRLLPVTAWLEPLWSLALFLCILYVDASSWPTLFTGQEHALSIIGGIMPVIALFMSALSVKNTHAALANASLTTPDVPYAGSERGLALALLAVSRARDTALAPSAVHTGQDADEVEALQTLARDEITPLAHPLAMGEGAGFLYALGVIAGLAVSMGSVGVAVWLAWPVARLLTGPAFMPLDIGILVTAAVAAIAGLLTGGVIAVRAASAWRAVNAIRANMTATVDGEGVTVRYSGPRGGASNQTRIAWRDARSLAKLSYLDAARGLHTVYILDAEGATILWEAPPVERYTAPDSRAWLSARREAAARLLSAALSGSGLPLLDLSATVASLREDRAGYGVAPCVTLPRGAYGIALREDDQSLALRLRGLLFPSPPGAEPAEPRWKEWKGEEYESENQKHLTAPERKRLLETMSALAPYLPESRGADPAARDRRLASVSHPRAARVARKVIVSSGAAPIAYLLFVCAFVFFRGQIASATASYSTPLERELPATVAGMAPSYFAPLDTPQPGWLVKSPSGADTRSAQFTAQGYTLTSSDVNPTLVATAPGVTMGDGVAQVTVSLSASISPDYNPTAGLLLQNRDGTTGVAFKMDSGGYWSLTPCDATSGVWTCENELAFGVSDSIQTDTPFTLLVVRRGTTYFLYLNGTLLQTVYDSDSAAAPGGPVGLLLDQGGGSAHFSDLLIYLTPAGLPFWAR